MQRLEENTMEHAIKCNVNCNISSGSESTNVTDNKLKNVAIRNVLQTTSTVQGMKSNKSNVIKSPHSIVQRRIYAKVIAPGEESGDTFSRCNSDSMFSNEYDVGNSEYDYSNEWSSNNNNNSKHFDCEESSVKNNVDNSATNTCKQCNNSFNDKNKSEAQSSELVESLTTVANMPYKRYKAKRPECLGARSKTERNAQAVWLNNNNKSKKCSVKNVSIAKQSQQSVSRIPDNHAVYISDNVNNTHPSLLTRGRQTNYVNDADETAEDKIPEENDNSSKSNNDKETNNEQKGQEQSTLHLPFSLISEPQQSHLSPSFSYLSTSSVIPTVHRYSAPVITHRFTDYDVVKQKYPFVDTNRNNTLPNSLQVNEPQVRLSAIQEYSPQIQHKEHKLQQSSEKELTNCLKEQWDQQQEHHYVRQHHTLPVRLCAHDGHVECAREQEQLKRDTPLVQENYEPRAKLFTDRRLQKELTTVVNSNENKSIFITSHSNDNNGKTSSHEMFAPLQLHTSPLLQEHELSTLYENEQSTNSKENMECYTSRSPRLRSRSAAWSAAISQSISGFDDGNVKSVDNNKKNRHYKNGSIVVDEHNGGNNDDILRTNNTSAIHTSDASFVYSVITDDNNVSDSNSSMTNNSNRSKSKSSQFTRKNSNSMSLFVHTMPSLMQQQEQQESSGPMVETLDSLVFSECSLINMSNTLPSTLQYYNNEMNNSFVDVNRCEYGTLSISNLNDANDVSENDAETTTQYKRTASECE